MNDNTDFMTWFCSLSDEDQIEALNAARRVAAEMGVIEPAAEELAEELRIDRIARDLLQDVEVTL